MSAKLDIAAEMAAFDRKDRAFFDSLDEMEKKKFSPFQMIRWGAGVHGNEDLQAYYLLSANENLNKNFYDISAKDHKKFLWLLATTVSPGVGKQYHKWLSAKKKKGTNKFRKALEELKPNATPDEIDLLLLINTDKEIKEYIAKHEI